MTTIDLWIGVFVRIILPGIAAMLLAAWAAERIRKA